MTTIRLGNIIMKKADRIALVTYASNKYPTTSYDEDTELLYFLRNKGLDVHYEVWDNPGVDWTTYDVAVLKSTWDYHEKYDRFLHWLDRLEKTNIQFLNPINTVRWNGDKRYLTEIMDSGLPAVPSQFFEQGSRPDISSLFTKLNTDKLIVKPCVSAGANNTLSLARSEAEQQRPYIHSLLADANYIVQPFMDEIHQGEWSLLFFNGKYSHSVLKVPKSGDFRVQHHLGGTTQQLKAPAHLVKQASKYVERFAQGTLYTRVDAVESNGQLVLMELELIEPYLFSYADSNALENYYHALTEIIHGNQA